MDLIKFARWPVITTVIAVIAAAFIGGLEVALIVLLLAVLEISISFDNAVVNASVLKTMSHKWQQIFLTWGILIAVFGMRLVFPIVIVAAAAGLGIPEVIDQALNEQELYAKNLEESNAVIAAFGGLFLLLVFLNFFFDPDKEEHWIAPLEKRLAGIGRVDSVSVGIAGTVLLIASVLVAEEHKMDVLVSGLLGIVVYLFVANIADVLEPEVEEVEDPETHRRSSQAHLTGLAGKAGFASFMYLEVLDASFSFDGVIGAFAISKDIIVIAVGLGLGALYIRTLTVYLVRQGTLQQYAFLEHGAHWAIGALAILLLAGIEYHVPEVVTGLLGAGLILLAFLASVRKNRREGVAT